MEMRSCAYNAPSRISVIKSHPKENVAALGCCDGSVYLAHGSLISTSGTSNVLSSDKGRQSGVQRWSPITNVGLVVIQLEWARWRDYYLLAVLGENRSLKVLRADIATIQKVAIESDEIERHNAWTEETIEAPGCISIAFSTKQCWLACACENFTCVCERSTTEHSWQRILTIGEDNSGNVTRRSLYPEPNEGAVVVQQRGKKDDKRKKDRDVVAVSWSDRTDPFLLAALDERPGLRLYQIFRSPERKEEWSMAEVFSDVLASQKASPFRYLSVAPSMARSFVLVAAACADHLVVVAVESASHRYAAKQGRIVQQSSGNSNTVFQKSVTQTVQTAEETLSLAWNSSGTTLFSTRGDGNVCRYSVIMRRSLSEGDQLGELGFHLSEEQIATAPMLFKRKVMIA